MAAIRDSLSEIVAVIGEPYCTNYACQIVKYVGPDALKIVPTLTNSLIAAWPKVSDWDRPLIAEALGALGDPSAREHLKNWQGSTSRSDVGAALTDALTRLGTA